jgi:Zincin-like metallopeptidase
LHHPAELNPPSFAGLGDLLTILVVAAAIVLVTAWLTTVLIGKETPEPEFRRLVDRSEALASLPPPERPPSEFDELVARDIYPDRIVIYQDTLERDFGHDPALLRAQVERTVRHELAHHLGWDERGVSGLGL